VPARLRAEGLVVHVMADVYPHLDTLDDVVWIREQTELGRVLLTKDRQIRRNEAEKEAVRESGARMFTIPKASLTGPQMADRLARNRHRIAQRSRRSGPYIYLVHDHTLELVFPVE
jgi:PIN like domain